LEKGTESSAQTPERVRRCVLWGHHDRTASLRPPDRFRPHFSSQVTVQSEPRPYLAPPDAQYAIIQFRAVVNAPGFLPAMAIDDVEFVEVEP